MEADPRLRCVLSAFDPEAETRALTPEPSTTRRSHRVRTQPLHILADTTNPKEHHA